MNSDPPCRIYVSTPGILQEWTSTKCSPSCGQTGTNLTKRWFTSAASKQARSSILVRSASGFLQVSLSKVLRPELSSCFPATLAEALPIKANDQGGAIHATTRESSFRVVDRSVSARRELRPTGRIGDRII